MKSETTTSVWRLMQRAVVFFAVALISVTAAGCSTMNTVSAMPTAIDFKVKGTQPPAGQALVYVVRPTLLGKPFAGYVTANGEAIGTTEGGIYIYAILAPGDYRFEVTGQDNNSNIAVKLEADKAYFIKQNVYPGIIKGITSLELVDDKRGRAALEQCKLGDHLGTHVLP